MHPCMQDTLRLFPRGVILVLLNVEDALDTCPVRSCVTVCAQRGMFTLIDRDRMRTRAVGTERNGTDRIGSERILGLG